MLNAITFQVSQNEARIAFQVSQNEARIASDLEKPDIKSKTSKTHNTELRIQSQNE